MHTKSLLLAAAITVSLILRAHAQDLPRTFGARALQLDDGTGSGTTLVLDLNGELQATYRLHFPLSGPPSELNFFAVDQFGNISWTNSTLPPLPLGHMWCGNVLGQAEPMPPGALGAILVVGTAEYGVPAPEWATIIPGPVTISASQITTGTIQPGVTINVGTGGTIVPTGGTVTANMLSGSGLGEYSGRVFIPTGANHIDISFPSILPLSSVTVSVFDPQAGTFGFVDAKVSQITPGIGFTVIFAADYPASGTGELHYIVVNP